MGLLQKKGRLLPLLPEGVQVHEISAYQHYRNLINAPPLWHIKRQLKSLHWIDAFVHLLLYAHFKLTGSRYWFYRWLLRHEPVMEGEYDVAVAFAGPWQMIDYYICEKVQAKEKWGWIHFDVSKIGIDRGMSIRLYRNYKHIYIVSKAAKQVFDNQFPQFSNKAEVRYNIVNKEAVLKLAEEGPSFTDNYQGTRILTVGRVSEEKGQRLALDALKLLRNKGCNIRWYFVGEGKDLDLCRYLAIDIGLSDAVQFLGLQMNPYGFMRNCDIYVQPSMHEGFCITLAEALCFSHPIVCTRFAGSEEQLKGRQESRVTDFTPEALAEGIEHFLS